ncbi:tRNA pseudouridine(55) synthase TruB [Nitrosomonas sp. Nm58]|uniref:tRNA pseudouridine(55) synthase TruB n=1 Tax=Nitrosomonas sp. Nm58 TaxID=200126 RepID=UPI00089A07BA|nr:tRNA pseudouridine(55) synthase TruB [Nitrosomonas sp. Nm58]SDY68017.1 tRNA pseudouridine55 synthase [Nitrosomonas sp. Nm58]
MSYTSLLSRLSKIKLIKRNISGVLLLNKPSGLTSNYSLQITKRFFGATKAGHTGTLDPMATGLLPICFGEATKFSAMLLSADKTYHATLKLGYISTTGDVEGEITAATRTVSSDNKLSALRIKNILQTFIGRIKQTPPMFSALKFNGKPLYKYARRGEEVERKPREIIIYDLCLNSWIGNEISIMVRCGAGTYIRTLAEDIGKALGFGGAYLTSLCRSQIGEFSLQQAHQLDQFQGVFSSEHDAYLYPIDSLLYNFPSIAFSEAETLALLQGQLINNKNKYGLPLGTKIRLYSSSGLFLGLGEITEIGTIAPKRLISSKGMINHITE